jgi:uncharacterized protein DUF5681
MAMTVVENRAVTTRRGGINGAGFLPGQSGNPGGRPKGLARRVRELVGDSGESIVQFMVDVLGDDSARTADRLEAAKWLADRGFGKAVQAVEIDVPVESWASVFARIPTEDLETMLAILNKHGLGGGASRRSLVLADR